MVSSFAGGVSSVAPTRPLVRTAVAESPSAEPARPSAEPARQVGGGGVEAQASRGLAELQDGWPSGQQPSQPRAA